MSQSSKGLMEGLVSGPHPTIRDVLATTLAEETFLKSMRRTFIDVGLVPFKEEDDGRTYFSFKEGKRGSFNPHLFPEPNFSLGELIEVEDEVLIETRQDAQANENDSDDGEEEEDSSDDEEQEIAYSVKPPIDPLPVAPGEWQGTGTGSA